MSRIGESKFFLIFAEIVKQSFSSVRKFLMKNFLPKLKLFWEPCSQVPILVAALTKTVSELICSPGRFLRSSKDFYDSLEDFFVIDPLLEMLYQSIDYKI